MAPQIGLKDHIGIKKGSKCDHISHINILEVSHQDLDTITVG